MSSLAEYIEQLHGADEAERIYAAEDIGYLNTAGGRARTAGAVGPGDLRARFAKPYFKP